VSYSLVAGINKSPRSRGSAFFAIRAEKWQIEEKMLSRVQQLEGL